MNGTPEVWHGPVAVPAPAATGNRTRALRLVVSIGLVGVLLFYALPLVVGTTLEQVATALRLVTAPESVVLTALWAAGLLVYSLVLTAALPGLSRRRALTLNLTGSAVSNVVPLGGAAGMSLNYLMIRSWGFGAARFSAYTLITNVWDVLLKLALPAVALIALLLGGQPVSSTIRWTGLVAAMVLVITVGVLVAALSTRRAATQVAHWLAPAGARLTRVVRRPVARAALVDSLLAFRDHVAEVVARRWPQLSLAMVGYGLLQAVLLWACLHAVGGGLAPVVVLAAYAVDRLMSMVIITPGGAGFAEAGAAATLVALGGDPAAMAAGVLLYRGFVFALEIPVGGAWLGGWWFLRRRRTSTAGEAEAIEELAA